MPAIPPLLPSPLGQKKEISQDIQILKQGLEEKDRETNRMKLATLTGFFGVMLLIGLDGCTMSDNARKLQDSVSRVKNIEGEVQKLQQKLQEYEDQKFNQRN